MEADAPPNEKQFGKVNLRGGAGADSPTPAREPVSLTGNEKRGARPLRLDLDFAQSSPASWPMFDPTSTAHSRQALRIVERENGGRGNKKSEPEKIRFKKVE